MLDDMGSEVEMGGVEADLIKSDATVHPAPVLVLASASARRLALLRQIGIEPQHLHDCNLDETPLKSEHPRTLAKRLARQKAETAQAAVRGISGCERALILAADTVVAVGRTILPKPETQEEARECLRLLSGRMHKIFTGVCLISARGQSHQRLVESRLRFARLSERVIDSYIEAGEWQGKAGGYAIQGLAGAFAVRLVGSYSNIVGLPLSETVDLLRGQNYPVFARWGRE